MIIGRVGIDMFLLCETEEMDPKAHNQSKGGDTSKLQVEGGQRRSRIGHVFKHAPQKVSINHGGWLSFELVSL